jgi:hypothetical protein
MSVAAVTVRRLKGTKNLEQCRLPKIIGVSHLKLNYGKKLNEKLKEGKESVSPKKKKKKKNLFGFRSGGRRGVLRVDKMR